MIDCMGQWLQVNDYVTFAALNKNKLVLRVGKVHHFINDHSRFAKAVVTPLEGGSEEVSSEAIMQIEWNE